MKIYEGIETSAICHESKKAIIYGEKKITFSNLRAASNQLAETLKADKKSDLVIIHKYENPVEALLLLIAAAKAEKRIIITDSSLPEEQLKSIAAEGEKSQENKEIFIGILSSGSTGTPKIIWRDHAGWTNGFSNQSRVFNITKEDTFFIGGSLAYSANLNIALHILNIGGSLVFPVSNFHRTWIKDIEKNKVSGVFLVPAYFRMLNKVLLYPLSGIKVLISGGEKMDLMTLEKIKINYPGALFFEFYGSSELGYLSYAAMEDIEKKPRSVGKAFPGVLLKIINNKIWAKSPYAAPEFRKWSTVNDLGYIDKEGFLFLDGREGGIINKGGIKIIPGDIEKIIRELPDVDDVAVIGVADKLRGETAVIFIETKNSKLKWKDIVVFLGRKISKQAMPGTIKILEEIPRNNFGKIDFKLLKSMI